MCVLDVAYGGESPPEEVWRDMCDRFEKESDKLLTVISTWIEYEAARRLVDGDDKAAKDLTRTSPMVYTASDIHVGGMTFLPNPLPAGGVIPDSPLYPSPADPATQRAVGIGSTVRGRAPAPT